VFGIGARQAIGVAARIRRLHEADGGSLTPGLVTLGAAERARPTIAAAVVAALALAPFVVGGDVAGNEVMHVTAAVILGGLVSTTLLNLFVLPAVYLRLGSSAAIAAPELVDDLGWAAPSTGPNP
jgi:Cu/Ag efflux pump CusA